MCAYYRRFGSQSKYIHRHSDNYFGSKYSFEDEYGEMRDNARTFKKEDRFYYINYINSTGDYKSEFTEMIENKQHAINRARWLANAGKWSLKNIPYHVKSIGVYDSRYGFIKEYEC